MKQLPLIRNDHDLQEALTELEKQIDADPAINSPEGDYIDALTLLIQAYEAKHHPIPSASPREVVQFYMDQNGLTQADLSRLLGSRSRSSEFLAGRRPLSLAQINKLRTDWGIAADLLISRDVTPEEDAKHSYTLQHVWTYTAPLQPTA